MCYLRHDLQEKWNVGTWNLPLSFTVSIKNPEHMSISDESLSMENLVQKQ